MPKFFSVKQAGAFKRRIWANHPQTENPHMEKPHVGNPDVEKPAQGFPVLENPAQVNTK